MKILVVVDMQNDFIDGSLGNIEAQMIVSNVEKKIAEYRDNNDIIIFTRDTHKSDYLNTQEGRILPVMHCIEGSEGHKITSRLEVKDSVIIDKPTFGSLELAFYIANNYNPQEIEIIGLCTDICVVSNAIICKAKFPEVTVTVDAACCAGVTKKSHREALNTMKMCQVNVIEQ